MEQDQASEIPLARLQRFRWIGFPLAVFAVLRIVTLLVAFVVFQQQPVQPPEWIYLNTSGVTYTQTLPPDAPFYALTAPWHRYDTVWYAKNALQGYQNDPGIVFLPLYWMLIRLIVPLMAGNYVLASLIISSAGCAVAFILLYRLVIDQFGDLALAKRVLISLAAFPTAYYLVAGYTESLFLAFVLSALLLALSRHWALAGLLAFLAALTRLQGIIICVPLFWIAYIQYRDRRWQEWLARLPVFIGAPLGTGLYLLYLRINNLGPMNIFYVSEWRSTTELPWRSVIGFIERWLNGQILYYESDNALILMAFVSLSLWVFWRFKPYFSLYTAVTLLALLMRYYETAQFDSMFRYVLQLFPCFIVIGMLLKNRAALTVYVMIGIVWQAIFLSRFVQWVWVA